MPIGVAMLWIVIDHEKKWSSNISGVPPGTTAPGSVWSGASKFASRRAEPIAHAAGKPMVKSPSVSNARETRLTPGLKPIPWGKRFGEGWIFSTSIPFRSPRPTPEQTARSRIREGFRVSSESLCLPLLRRLSPANGRANPSRHEPEMRPLPSRAMRRAISSTSE